MPSNTGEASHGPVKPGGPTGPGYETRDANMNAVLAFLVGLVLVLVLVLFVTWQLFRFFGVAELAPAPASPFAGARQVPPSPELQVNSRADLIGMQAKQQQELETYGWENRSAGTVRIPIERAMDLLLQKGLPVLPSGAAETSGGDSIAKKRKDGPRAGAVVAEGSKGNE
jgi:hypothetical protein